jgi:hemerythrin
MTILFVWNERYEFGNDKIDAQHRTLFDLGNRIQQISDDEITACIMELYKYATRHFRDEEAVMRTIGYSDLNHHKALHDKFISDLNFITRIPGNDLLDRVTHFLHEWLIDHIIREDRKIAGFFKSKM